MDLSDYFFMSCVAIFSVGTIAIAIDNHAETVAEAMAEQPTQESCIEYVVSPVGLNVRDVRGGPEPETFYQFGHSQPGRIPVDVTRCYLAIDDQAVNPFCEPVW